MKRILLGALCAVALAGCGDHEAERKAQAACGQLATILEVQDETK
jgi:uncharacterized lipoprotein YehR (DUF1307 family)